MLSTFVLELDAKVENAVFAASYYTTHFVFTSAFVFVFAMPRQELVV